MYHHYKHSIKPSHPIDSFRGFIEEFCLFSNRSEALVKPQKYFFFTTWRLFDAYLTPILHNDLLYLTLDCCRIGWPGLCFCFLCLYLPYAQPTELISGFGFVSYFHPYTPPPRVMGCGVAEATGLGFVCFAVNPSALSANRVRVLFVSLIIHSYPCPHFIF